MIRVLVLAVIAGLFAFVVLTPVPSQRMATGENLKSVKVWD